MQIDELIAGLKEAADILEVTDANAFQINAFRKAAQSLEQWDGDLGEAVEQSTVTDIPSVGKGIAKVIEELWTTNKSSDIEEIRSQVPSELPELLRVRGLGPKRVRTLWQELEIDSPASLRKSAEAGEIQKLKGFGAKTVEKIVASLDYLEKGSVTKRTVTPLADVTMPKAAAASGRVLVGTSGFSYDGWRGNFFSEDAKTSDFLSHYCDRLPTVEINNTFYRFPSQKVVQKWIEQTGDTFQFAIKAHSRITHKLRLSDAARDTIIEFVERCGELGSRFGCVLFQLPPDFSRDDKRLDLLLSSLPEDGRYALEFRHSSWYDKAVLRKLRDRNIACVAGGDESTELRETLTADFAYVRLRRNDYSVEELSDWNDRFAELAKTNVDVLAYLKHDDEGVIPSRIADKWGK